MGVGNHESFMLLMVFILFRLFCLSAQQFNLPCGAATRRVAAKLELPLSPPWTLQANGAAELVPVVLLSN